MKRSVRPGHLAGLFVVTLFALASYAVPASAGSAHQVKKPLWVFGTLVSISAPHDTSITWSSPDQWAEGHGYESSRVEIRLANGILQNYKLAPNANVVLQGSLVILLSGAPVRIMLVQIGKVTIFEELVWSGALH